jgi:hypothetical protein
MTTDEDTTATTTTSQTVNDHSAPSDKSNSENHGATENSILNRCKSMFQKISLPAVPDTSTMMASFEESAAPHLKDGLIHGAVGAALGGAIGTMMFKAGKGNRVASVAAGVGVAFGSTLERVSFEWQQNKKSD